MASGTPILTTKLPGMPSEYYPHIYSFEEETTEGYACIINHVMNLPAEDLHAKVQKLRHGSCVTRIISISVIAFSRC